MQRDDRPPPIGMAQDHVTACLMVYNKARPAEDADKLFRSERRKSHREGTVMGTLSVLMTSDGPSSGMGSPCLSKLAQ